MIIRAIVCVFIQFFRRVPHFCLSYGVGGSELVYIYAMEGFSPLALLVKLKVGRPFLSESQASFVSSGGTAFL